MSPAELLVEQLAQVEIEAHFGDPQKLAAAMAERQGILTSLQNTDTSSLDDGQRAGLRSASKRSSSATKSSCSAPRNTWKKRVDPCISSRPHGLPCVATSRRGASIPPRSGASAELARALRCWVAMELDPLHAAQSVRFIEARLEAIHARIRASRARPLDRAAVEELTALRFAGTRLSRRLRLLAATGAGQGTVELLDPARELESELHDARAEAVRRGALVSLSLAGLSHFSRKLSFIDSLASLVEDGIDAGANYLSLETRLHGDQIYLRLTTDAKLQRASLGVYQLGPQQIERPLLDGLCSLELKQIAPSLTRISLSLSPRAHAPLRAHGSKRWTAPSPSRL
jgi:hypothetical protein